jgi:hypothetical protein
MSDVERKRQEVSLIVRGEGRCSERFYISSSSIFSPYSVWGLLFREIKAAILVVPDEDW